MNTLKLSALVIICILTALATAGCTPTASPQNTTSENGVITVSLYGQTPVRC